MSGVLDQPASAWAPERRHLIRDALEMLAVLQSNLDFLDRLS
jgi:hypothetical protein